jgi:hypothetical protein
MEGIRAFAKGGVMKIKMLLLGAVAGAGPLMALAAPAFRLYRVQSLGRLLAYQNRYSRPGLSFEYYPDDWYFHRNWDDRRYRWRAYRAGRGYWRNSVWITF